MPYQRTITIYEYIPLDEIRDQLDEEEQIMVEVINHRLKQFRDASDYEETGLSWDELLIWHSDEGELASLKKSIFTTISEKLRHPPDWLKEQPNYRGILIWLDEDTPKSNEQRLEIKLRELIVNENRILKPASEGGITFWLHKEILVSTLQLYDQKQDNLEKYNELIIGDYRNVLELSTAMFRGLKNASKGRRRIKFQCIVITQVLTEKNENWLNFEPSKSGLTHEHLYNLCRVKDPKLFAEHADGGTWMRVNMWPNFKLYRNEELNKTKNSMFLQTDLSKKT